MRRIWLGIVGGAVLTVMVSIGSAHAASPQAHTTCHTRTVAQEKAFLRSIGAGEMADRLKSVTFSCQDHDGPAMNWGGQYSSISAPSR